MKLIIINPNNEHVAKINICNKEEKSGIKTKTEPRVNPIMV